MKTVRQFSLISILFLLFFTSLNVYAESDPTFDTLAATSITNSSVYLHGDFYSESTDRFPLLWFQYGTDSSLLNKKTDDIVETKKDFIYSQLVSNLEPETKYYFRTALEINSSIYYGDIFSFVTLPSNKNIGNINNINYSNGSPNEALDKMLQDYDTSLSQGSSNKSNSKDYVYNTVNDGRYSFFDFFKWFLKKKDKSVTRSNIVHPEEEIKQKEAERQERLEKLSEQKRYNNSASEDDELGEIVKYNTNYNSRVKSDTKSVFPVILFIVILLIFVFLLYRIYFLKKGMFFKHKDNLREMDDSLKQNNRRYNIPIKRDLHDPIQNPNPEADISNNNNKFFRNNHKK